MSHQQLSQLLTLILTELTKKQALKPPNRFIREIVSSPFGLSSQESLLNRVWTSCVVIFVALNVRRAASVNITLSCYYRVDFVREKRWRTESFLLQAKVLTSEGPPRNHILRRQGKSRPLSSCRSSSQIHFNYKWVSPPPLHLLIPHSSFFRSRPLLPLQTPPTPESLSASHLHFSCMKSFNGVNQWEK